MISASGRWFYLSADPIGLAGGMNLYAYVKNNPVNWIDSRGLAPGDLFSTQNAAAIDAIDFIMSQSVNENVEYGGYVYKNPDGNFSCTSAVPGDYKSINVSKFNQPDECAGKTAFYHTHQSGDRMSIFFSTDDYLVSNFNKLQIYLGTPKWLVKSFTPGI